MIALPARLQTYSHPGEIAREPVVHDVRASLLRAGRGGAALLRGLVPLAGRESGREIDERAPLIFGWNPSYPDVQNDLAAWSGTKTYVRREKGRFGGTAYALQFENELPNSVLDLTTVFTVPRNTPFSVRWFACKADKNAAFPVSGFRFGQWQVQVTKQGAEIALRKPPWTAQAEADMNVIRAAEGYDAALDDARERFYQLFRKLPSGLDFDGAQFYDFHFIPESGGALNVLVGDELERIFLPDLIVKRETGQTIYDAGPLSLFGRGQGFAWQTGYPVFGTAGNFTFPIRLYATPDNGVNEFAIFTKRLIADEPAGTAVTLDFEDKGSRGDLDDGTASPEHRFDMKVSATTGDTRVSPFIYAAQVLGAALPRTGANGALFYDSSDPANMLTPSISLIEDVTMSCEAENWARQYTVIIADPDGRALPVQSLISYEASEGRHASLSVGGLSEVKNGLVGTTERLNMMAVEKNQVPIGLVAGAASRASVQVNDGWQLLDEHIIRDDIDMDGLTIGAGIRLLLQNAGWTTAEIANVSADYGRKFPKAAPGEEPCEVARRGERTGSVIRRWMERWTLGAYFWHDFNGVWSIETPSQSPIMTLSRDATIDSRRRYWAPLDLQRDFGNCYNDFLVVGQAPNGDEIAAWWTIWEGFRWAASGTGRPSVRFIGRKRTYDPVYDSGLRTMDDVMWVLRCLVAKFGRSGQFVSVESHNHRNLLPGRTIELFRETAAFPNMVAVPYWIYRVGSSSAKTDRRTLILQEKD